ncbi:hypothetical protein BYT27DRAFT_7203066 [Phlegmacium glaucopus]|nr:hypothetical protein BYT27DRAFT_7203066 [Phlegmacium glaucopus]
MASYYKAVDVSLTRNWSADWIQGHSVSFFRGTGSRTQIDYMVWGEIERNKSAFFTTRSRSRHIKK